MDRERQSQDKTISKVKAQLHTAHSSVRSLRQRLYQSKDKVEATFHESLDLQAQLFDIEGEFTAKDAALEGKIELLITEVEVAQHERDILSERLDYLQSNTIRTKKGQKFVDGVRQCCLELLAVNVATNQVEPVIRTVLLNIASVEVGELPKSSSLSGMLVEVAPEFKDMYKQRRKKQLEAKVLRDKQLALLREKEFQEKEKLTEEIMLYGLWQNESQVTSALEKLSSTSEKLSNVSWIFRKRSWSKLVRRKSSL